MREFYLLLWATSKELGAGLRYWLRVLGFTQGRTVLEWIYEGYAVGVGAGLLFFVWLDALALVHGMGVHVIRTPAVRQAAFGLLPPVVLAAQVLLVAVAASVSPWRLRVFESAYVAASPMPRQAVAAAFFLRAAPWRMLVVALAAALTASFLAPDYATLQSAALASLPVTLLTLGLMWLVGLARLAIPGLRRLRSVAWMGPLLLGGLALIASPAFRWPGAVLRRGLATGSAPGALWLLALALAAVVGAVAVSGKVRLTDVSDESQLFARVQANRAFSTLSWTNTAATMQARSEVSLAGAKPFLALPAAMGTRIVVLKTGLGYLRRRRTALGLFRDVSVVLLGVFVLAGAKHSESWILWVAWAGLFTPRSLTAGFTADMTRPFLRRLLPFSDLGLLAANTALPGAGVALACAVVWLLTGSGNVALGFLFIPILIALRTLCAALATTRTLFQGQVRLPFWALSILASGIVAALAVPFGRPWLALVAALAITLVLMAVEGAPWRVASET